MQKYLSRKEEIKTFSDGSIFSQQPGVVGNFKGSSSGRRVMQEGNLDLHKGIDCHEYYVCGKYIKEF